MRLDESNEGEMLPYEDFCKSSVSPEAIGRTLKTSKSPTKKHIAPFSPIKASFDHSDSNDNLCYRHFSYFIL